KIAVEANNRGDLYAYTDGTRLYFAVIVSANVNDNVFDASVNPRDYVRSVNWPQGRNHLAKDLINSERMSFAFACNGNYYEWSQDLAHLSAGSWVSNHLGSDGGGTPPSGISSGSSTAWNFQNSNWWQIDPTARPSASQDFEDWKSPGYAEGGAFNKAAHGYPYWDSANSWEWPIVYEFSYPHPCPGESFYFRVLTAHNSPPKDGNQDVIIYGYDYGDAPSTFPTLLANDGARHLLTPNLLRLGRFIDAEPDGQPASSASTDDQVWSDDEDGVTFTSNLTAGQTQSIVVVASGSGYLNAWIDFNRDGDWNDAGEQIFTNTALTAGARVLTFTVPANASIGDTYARFRLSTQVGLSPAGTAPDGEVEDYKVTIVAPNYDFGDLPDTGPGTSPGNYQTLLSDDGPRHVIVPTLRLGSLLDSETNGQPTAGANGDDNNGSNDEDAIAEPIQLRLNTQPTLAVNVYNMTGSPAILTGWVDLNRNGVFESGESASVWVPSGTNGPINLTLPTITGSEGLTFARFRLSTQNVNGNGTLNPTGALMDGEVEDYIAQISLGYGPEDRGDAPASYGEATHTNLDNDLQLGPPDWTNGGVMGNVDGENISYYSGNATGDNLNNVDDENGVSSFPALKAGQTSYSAIVSVYNQTDQNAILVGWIDFNRDGVFTADEGTSAIVPAGTIGTVTLTWTNLTGLTAGTTYARFRIAPVGSGLSTSTPEGTISGGEVEDYMLTIENPIGIGLTSFSAVRKENGVLIEWQAETAKSRAGYNLYRSSGENSPFIRLNSRLITDEDAVSAGKFEWIDTAASNGLYKLEEVGMDGSIKVYGPINIMSTANVAQNRIPKDYALRQNYPNPFNPATTIPFELPEAAVVKIAVYDMSGKQVKVLVDGIMEAGTHAVVWNAVDDNNSPVPSGMYIVRFSANGHQSSRKMLLVR
ncbi:MAG: GEVED domain-containing protein, partial [candidate division KSB1 bacterium]|nr:GEVED domain-containing protein [candidate division KSB1 bacterium]